MSSRGDGRLTSYSVQAGQKLSKIEIETLLGMFWPA